jgi:hypothetical protein
MEDTKLVKITEWGPRGIRTKGQPQNRWRDEVRNYLKMLNLRNFFQLVRDRNA